MKNILASFLGLFLVVSPVLAGEVITNPEQKADDNIAVISVQKQPTSETAQRQRAVKNIGCIIIQVNGKVIEQPIQTKAE